MLKNYFYIKRSLSELKPKISGKKIYEIFTQEKDTVFLHIPGETFPGAHLIVSLNPQLSYLQYKTEFHKAKKNTTDFLSGSLPQKIENVMIAEKDRIVLILLEETEIYILFHGSKSNMVFSDKRTGSVSSFKKLSDVHKIVGEVSQNVFINPAEFYEQIININTEGDLTGLRKEYPNVSKEIIEEVRLRKSLKPDEKLEALLNETIREIETGKIVTGFSEEESKIRFLPAGFNKAGRLINSSVSHSFEEALQNYLSLHFGFLQNLKLKKEIAKYLDKELSRLANKMNKLKGRIENGSKEIEYNKYGTLLLNHRHLIKKGMKEFETADYDSGEKIKIKLDPKLSPQENIERYFEKSRDEKTGFKKSVELFKQTEKRYEELKTIELSIQNTDDIEELRKIKRKLKISGNEIVNKSENKYKFRRFLIDGKYSVFVGKDSKSNDYLSIKFAKQNDYWFHARGLAGSHVVLRVDNPKEGVPKNILKKAASIAAFYSKGKTAGITPVSYTFAKYVHKKKGMEPGKVMISKEKVLLVTPEIPKGCEQINE